MRIVKTADDALHEINKNFMKLDDVDIAKSNQIVDFLKIDVVSYLLWIVFIKQIFWLTQNVNLFWGLSNPTRQPEIWVKPVWPISGNLGNTNSFIKSFLF